MCAHVSVYKREKGEKGNTNSKARRANWHVPAPCFLPMFNVTLPFSPLRVRDNGERETWRERQSDEEREKECEK